MFNSSPYVSVLMPILNGEKHLREAIDSILNQSFKDFELLLLVEYGSNDESKRIIKSYTDDRIVIIENSEHLGLPKSLNVGIQAAKGKYIARMDADDISYNERLKLQVDYLDSHQDVDLIGTNSYINGNFIQKTNLPQTYDEIRFVICLRNCLMHPTVMWRKNAFQMNGECYNDIPHSEDYDLWIRVVPNHKIINLKKALISYRMDGSGKGATTDWQKSTYEIRNRMINSFGLKFDVLESFYELSKNSETFDKKMDCIKQLAHSFDFQKIKNVFTKEVCRILIINKVNDYKDLWSYFYELYELSDESYVRNAFRSEFFRQKLRWCRYLFK